MRLKLIALSILLSLILGAALVAATSSSTYSNQDRETPYAESSMHHLAGTDALGRDRLVRVCVGLLLCLSGSLLAAAVTTAAAALVGSMAAFSPGYLRSAVMILCDLFLALPWLFLLMMVRSALPLTTSPSHSAAVTFLVLAALGWPACARAVYRGAVDLRNAEWMLHARASGLGRLQMLRHVLPNLFPLLLPQFLISIPAFVIAEANLGALGLGIGEPLPSWGGMLLELDNSALLLRTRWVYLPIMLLVLTLLLLEALTAQTVRPPSAKTFSWKFKP